MKQTYRNIAGLSLLIALCASAGYSQQQFTQTVTAANRNCNSVCSVLDVPDLNNNPAAVIFVTPVGNARDLNPHPIGAYYMYLKKWSIFNLDGTAIPEGAKYKVEYYVNSGPDRFVYMVPRQVRLSDIPYIDREGLNGNPNAQIRVFPTSSRTHGALYNRDDVKVEYDAKVGKWYMANVNGKPVPWEAVYNISISSGGIANTTLPTPVSPRRDDGIVDSGRTPPPAPVATPAVKGPLTPPVIKGPPSTVETTGPLSPAPKGPLSSPTPRWTLRPEPLPTIAPNSEILLFLHGMDSRAEEADDITKELFALRGSGNQPQTTPMPPTPASSPSVNAAMIPVLQQLLLTYKGCILERYETQGDMRARGLNGNLSGLTNTTGLQVRETVKCVAGNNCSLAFRATQLFLLQAQVNRGDATNLQSKLESIIPADCFLCAKHMEMHTKHVHCTMDAGGNNGVHGLAFEGCKAGVDIAKLANDVVSDITGFTNDIFGIKLPETEMIGGPSVATNFRTAHFASPEPCDHPDLVAGGQRLPIVPFDKTVDGQQVRLYYEPIIPPSLLDTPPPTNKQINVPAARYIGQNEGRLRPDLRLAAKAAKPDENLRSATYKFAASNVAGNIETATALADLSVTGRAAFAAFSKALPQESFCQLAIAERPALLNESDVLKGCYKALDRAYAVANFLRTGERGDTPAEKARKTRERNELGYIAVSGEDDQPHRPVNAPSSDYPQYDIDVDVAAPMSAGPQKSVSVRTRYVIAQSGTSANNAKNLVVISLDLPTSGYTQNLDYDLISPLSAIGNPKWTHLPVPIVVPVEVLFAIPGLPPILPPGFIIPPGTPLPDFQSTGNTPLLDFIETFVVNFTETLNQKVPIKSNIKAVMGGSLGGNMTFRLGRRPGVPWLPKFIVWSPASIWSSLGEGNDILKHIAPRKAWENAQKASENATNTNPLPGAGDRADFFGAWDGAIAWPIVREAQSGTWTSDFYACKLSSVAGARLDRHETYDALFLAWHWRLGAEQLLYSHQTIDPMTNRPRYMSNQKPMLLACGLEDQVPYNDICPATQKTAKLMTLTPGKALFLGETGHSLDNERRMFWAQQILDFLK